MNFKKLIPERFRRAGKVILGKSVSEPVLSHAYKIQIEDSKRFADVIAMVTGGTGAIGSAICYELAACGAKVGMCGRTEEKIQQTIEMIRCESPSVAENIIPVVLDVNNDAQIESAICNFVRQYGKISVFINNAGGQPGRVGGRQIGLCERTISEIDLILDTNLRGTILCSRIVARYMIEQNAGTIINMASVIGTGGKAGMSDYAASKAGIVGFTKSLALELGKHNIRVNCISPGLINQVLFDEGSCLLETSKNVLGRVGTTKEIADMVCYLIHDKYITGQNFHVDGGRSVGLFGD